jgi:hypothetical protein
LDLRFGLSKHLAEKSEHLSVRVLRQGFEQLAPPQCFQ